MYGLAGLGLVYGDRRGGLSPQFGVVILLLSSKSHRAEKCTPMPLSTATLRAKRVPVVSGRAGKSLEVGLEVPVGAGTIKGRIVSQESEVKRKGGMSS